MRKVLRKLSPAAAAPEPNREPVRQSVPPVDWGAVKPQVPPGKRMISLRLDADVLAYFQSEGRGYQTRMNAVLRGYMNALKDAP